jgi:hypothetical protein
VAAHARFLVSSSHARSRLSGGVYRHGRDRPTSPVPTNRRSFSPGEDAFMPRYPVRGHNVGPAGRGRTAVPSTRTFDVVLVTNKSLDTRRLLSVPWRSTAEAAK